MYSWTPPKEEKVTPVWDETCENIYKNLTPEGQQEVYHNIREYMMQAERDYKKKEHE